MNNISIITPPDMLFNDVYSLVLISPNSELKKQIQLMLGKAEESMNVYFYEENGTENIQWLLTVCKMADNVILDIDNATPLVRTFSTYILSLPNTFYLTNDNLTPYNLLSQNRFYDMTWLENIFNRGKNE